MSCGDLIRGKQFDKVNKINSMDTFYIHIHFYTYNKLCNTIIFFKLFRCQLFIESAQILAFLYVFTNRKYIIPCSLINLHSNKSGLSRTHL